MSAMGHAAYEVADDEDDETPGLWTSFAIALRLIVGWFCVAIGVLNLLVELDRTSGTTDLPYLIFHAVLLVGGVLLLALGWIGPNPGAVGYWAGGTVAGLGVIISAIPATTTVCCLTAFSVRHGFPYTFMARDVGARWHIDSQHTLADLLFWGYCGLFALLAVSLFRQPADEIDEPGGPPMAEPRQYIEHRTEAPDRIVGPLP
jgi:hypothetical protein